MSTENELEKNETIQESPQVEETVAEEVTTERKPRRHSRNYNNGNNGNNAPAAPQAPTQQPSTAVEKLDLAELKKRTINELLSLARCMGVEGRSEEHTSELQSQ